MGDPVDGLDLEGVVLLGRTFEEYRRCFGLSDEDLAGAHVLDVGGGVSSFSAEADARGLDVTAADPIYGHPADVIEARCRRDLDNVAEQLPGVTHKYRWTYYRNVAHLREFRERAYQVFLEDFRRHGGERYVPAELPYLPFRNAAFTHVLVSHLLFLYDETLDLDFHLAAVRELARLASREVRIYPLVNMKGERSRHLDAVLADPELQSLRIEERPVDFEFLGGATACLVLTRP